MSENEELEELTKEDRDRPTLFSFFLLEFLKWGGLLLVLYVFFSFLEPIWRPVYEFGKEVVSGNNPKPDLVPESVRKRLDTEESHRHK